MNTENALANLLKKFSARQITAIQFRDAAIRLMPECQCEVIDSDTVVLKRNDNASIVSRPAS